MSECTHSIIDHTNAWADGMCSHCQADRIDELERELAEARGQQKCCPDCGRLWLKDKACPWCEADEAREDKQQAEQRAERYKAALGQYGCHHPGCAERQTDFCTCGFLTALAIHNFYLDYGEPR